MGLAVSTEQAEAAQFQQKNLYGVSSTYQEAKENFQEVLASQYQTETKAKDLSGMTESMDDIFEDAAAKFGISSRLLKAVAKAESNFNPNAVSRAGAQGVMQLMPSTARSLGVTNAFDARQNIMGGAQYLKTNLDRFGEIPLALAAYNAGPNNVEKYGGIPPFSETQNYVKNILANLGEDEIYANRQVATGSTNSNFSSENLSNLVNLYTMNNLMTSQNHVGSFPDSDDSSDSNGFSSFSSLSGITGFGSLGNLASLGSSGSISGLMSLYGTGTNNLITSALLQGISASNTKKNGDSELSETDSMISIDKEMFSNLLEILKLQMMMSADQAVGNLTFT